MTDKVSSDNMPHATMPHSSQEDQDDILIQQALDPENPVDFSRELEPGEKADDAIDFGDLSDDDLAEDEEDDGANTTLASRADNPDTPFEDLGSFMQDEELPDLMSMNGPDGDGDGFDDLFGDAPSSPVRIEDVSKVLKPTARPETLTMPFDFVGDEILQNPSDVPRGLSPVQTQESSETQRHNLFRPVDFGSATATLSKEQQMQQALFAMSGSGYVGTEAIPAPENHEELLASLWPKFERRTTPRFMDLLPSKTARYVGKPSLKRPRPMQMNKANLELAPDQEKNFRLSLNPAKRNQYEIDRPGNISISQIASIEKDSDEDMDLESDFENETIGGVTWQDLQVVCEDWDTHSLAASPNNDGTQDLEAQGDSHSVSDGFDCAEDFQNWPSAKVCLLNAQA